MLRSLTLVLLALVAATTFSYGQTGCTIPSACNYEPTAVVNDGSCIWTFDCNGTCGGSFILDECENCYDPEAAAGTTFQFTGSIETWEVPTDGTYTIEVAGAQGGTVNSSNQGGLGAVMRGDFFLTAGTQLQILVGREGFAPSNTSNEGGGGGGGSFVAV